MDKLDCYRYLIQIKNNHNVDISYQIKSIAGLNESVPVEVIKFIHKYIPQYEMITLDHIYEKRHRNPLYKSLVNEKSSDSEKVIALSSFMTQAMIGARPITDHSLLSNYYESLKINKISQAISEYTNGNPEKLRETFDSIRTQFKSIY